MNQQNIYKLFDLSGLVAVVSDSGALSSIDVAPLLADAGATVVVADSETDKSQALVERINSQGGQALSVPTDIEREDSVKALFQAVRERFGRLDILVNCVGVTSNQPLLETTLEQFDDLQSVNQRSTFLLMREGVRLMVDAGHGGRIVNVTTIGTLHPVLNGNAAYASSRSGVTGMTRSVALDFAKQGIRANVVVPGAISAKIRFHPTMQARMAAGGSFSGPIMDDAARRLPFGMGTGADIASAVLYLVSPASAYVTGQSVVVDGGFLIS